MICINPDKFYKKYKEEERFKERLEVLLESIGRNFPRGSKLIDFGCGPGVIALELLKRGYKVTGIDGSLAMINMSRNLTKGFVQSKFLVKKIPEELNEVHLDSKFQGVVASSVIEYIPEISIVFDWFYQILDYGGIAMISLPNRESIYRKLELISYYLFRKPEYLRFVYHRTSLKLFNDFLKSKGFVLVEHKYFSKKFLFPKLFEKILPKRLLNTMILLVIKKSKNV